MPLHVTDVYNLQCEAEDGTRLYLYARTIVEP
jgi:hypothetical protein